MTVNDIVTDYAIHVVFKNTNFGNYSYRTIIENNLKNVLDGYSIGYTAKHCLIGLGLIKERLKDDLIITALGYEYLEALKTK